MADEISILVVRDRSASSPAAAQWAQRSAREHGAQCLEAPPAAPSAVVIDFIALGSGWRSEDMKASASQIVRHVVRATPCPLLTV